MLDNQTSSQRSTTSELESQQDGISSGDSSFKHFPLDGQAVRRSEDQASLRRKYSISFPPRGGQKLSRLQKRIFPQPCHEQFENAKC